MSHPAGQEASTGTAETRIKRFRAALGPLINAAESSRLPMIFTDAQGADHPLIFANDSFLALTGFERDAIVGGPLAFLLGAVSDSDALASVQDSLVTGVDGAWELHCRRADGTEFLAEVHLSPVRDANGVIRQNFLSFVNLDRHAAQRNEMHALYEQAPGFIAVSEGPEHVFTFANAAYRRLVGRTHLVGLSVAKALPETVEQGIISKLDQVFRTGEPLVETNVPISFNPSDGSPTVVRYVNFVYQPVRNAGKVITGLFCEGYDVSAERKAAKELSLLQAELIHLSRANAMGAMATTIAHELNQPLVAISSYVAGCVRLIEPVTPNADKLRDALQATEEASQRAGEIIRQVRELTRRGAPATTCFDAKAAIEECVRLVRAGGCEGVELHNHTADGIMMVADRIQIQQVIINLLRNACDAVVATSERRVTIVAELKNRAVVVSVRDTGAGVPLEAARGIFSWTDTTKEGGMGLGLSISRTIIEGHRGRIWLDRSDATGSTFCFSVPSASSDEGSVPGDQLRD